MNKIALNRAYGGFSLNDEALTRMLELDPSLLVDDVAGLYDGYPAICEPDDDLWHSFFKGRKYASNFDMWEYRTHPILIAVLEELGVEKCSSEWCTLELIELAHTDYEIFEYDGWEELIYTRPKCCRYCGQPIEGDHCGGPMGGPPYDYS